jgi:hypothetical protein
MCGFSGSFVGNAETIYRRGLRSFKDSGVTGKSEVMR